MTVYRAGSKLRAGRHGDHRQRTPVGPRAAANSQRVRPAAMSALARAINLEKVPVRYLLSGPSGWASVLACPTTSFTLPLLILQCNWSGWSMVGGPRMDSHIPPPALRVVVSVRARTRERHAVALAAVRCQAFPESPANSRKRVGYPSLECPSSRYGLCVADRMSASSRAAACRPPMEPGR